MKVPNIELARFEPTVFGAVRRNLAMVIAIAFLTTAAAVGYASMGPKIYTARATVTVPQTSLSQGEGSDQYLDSQVLLLQSQAVADRAAEIANAALNTTVLSAPDLSGEGTSLKITPPQGSTPGSYGSSIIAVSFTWPDATVARVGTNAVLQAFDDVRAAAIAAEGEARVAAIEAAIRDVRTRAQLKDLVNLRTSALVNQQVDLARHPTVMWAETPQAPVNGSSRNAAAAGLVAGTVLGTALAYARASRRRCIWDRLDPAAIYGAPLIWEITTSWAERKLRLGAAGAEPLPMATDPQSWIAEEFRFAAGTVERVRLAHQNRLVVAFVSAGTGTARSSIVANVALAVANSRTRVLAVDADTGDGRLTALLAAPSPSSDGLEQVLAGQRTVADCAQPSPLNQHLAVLGSGTASTTRAAGTASTTRAADTAYPRAIREMIGEAKESFDLVLIDSPALLRVADGTDVVDSADAAIIVTGFDERVQDHLTMAERLHLVESEIIGYIHLGARSRQRFARRAGGREPARVARREWTEVPSW